MNPQTAEHPLGEISPEAFLDEYWQKKPLLIRDAFPDFESPISPEELAGLALEESVESRLIQKEGGDYPWQMRHGPFQEKDFLNLPETHWTVLVQEVDKLLPQVAEIRERFRFVPDWRIDDVMVSYAAPHGGVGAHIDNYDVFLLQGLGRRKWQIGTSPVQNEELVPDLDIRILANFEPDEEYIVGPGDMLYLPPRIAHRGTALDDCLTFSIGFRAPGHRELLGSFLDHVLEQIPQEARYTDADLSPPDHPAEIRPTTLSRIRSLIQDALGDDDFIDDWFGRFITASKRGHIIQEPDENLRPQDVQQLIQNGAALRRAPAARMAFINQNGTAQLYAGGSRYDATTETAKTLTQSEYLPNADLQSLIKDDSALELITALYNDGILRREME